VEFWDLVVMISSTFKISSFLSFKENLGNGISLMSLKVICVKSSFLAAVEALVFKKDISFEFN
jgi:hypothetical protein